MSKIKHIFLDLDDTIFDFHRSESSALSKMLRELGIEPTKETVAAYSKINRACWESLERGETTREKLLVERFERLFKVLGKDADPRAAQKLYEGNLANEYIYIDGAMELILSLHGKYKLYLASNGTARVQDSRIEKSGIAKYFDGIFISERIGHDKPSREFFEKCFSSIENFSKEEAIIVGDSLTSDILGGINAGITTCWYNPSGKPPRVDIAASYEISSLDELSDILRRI